jgi:hypothetical protein
VGIADIVELGYEKHDPAAAAGTAAMARRSRRIDEVVGLLPDRISAHFVMKRALPGPIRQS